MFDVEDATYDGSSILCWWIKFSIEFGLKRELIGLDQTETDENPGKA